MTKDSLSPEFRIFKLQRCSGKQYTVYSWVVECIDAVAHNCLGNNPTPATVHLIYTRPIGSLPLKKRLN